MQPQPVFHTAPIQRDYFATATVMGRPALPGILPQIFDVRLIPFLLFLSLEYPIRDSLVIIGLLIGLRLTLA